MLALALAVLIAADPPSAAVDTIRTKDGKLHAGKVLSETANGYLFRDDLDGSTAVIPFGEIFDLKRANDAPTVARQPLAESPPSSASVVAEADRLVRVQQLTRDLADKRNELDDATPLGPWVKIVGGGLLAAAFISSGSAWYSASPDQQSGSITLITAGAVVGVALFIWGIVQHVHRSRVREEVPAEIQALETQLRALDVPQVHGILDRNPLPAAPSVEAASPPTQGRCSQKDLDEMRAAKLSDSAIESACSAP